jgi:putative tryptophan/tyrosine transport system substrate-binding protein
MHTCPITVALVSLMLPSQHHAKILLIRKCFRPAPKWLSDQYLPHSITRRPTRTKAELDAAYDAISKQNVNGLLVFPEAVTLANRMGIVDFAAKRRLPSMLGWKEYVEAGGLMSYGPNRDESYRRIAVYVDKILKGTKPADLPVELPMRFELVINLKTAKDIGVTVTPNVLARADRVIR